MASRGRAQGGGTLPRGATLSVGHPGLSSGATTTPYTTSSTPASTSPAAASLPLPRFLRPYEPAAAGSSSASLQGIHPDDAPSDEDGQEIADEAEAEDQSITTIMLLHIACRYTKVDVAAILDQVGFDGKYDFVHVPMSPCRPNNKLQSNFGYAFVNFTEPRFVAEFRRDVQGTPFGQSSKACQVRPARIQGAANLARKFNKKSKKHRSTPMVIHSI